MFSSIPAFLVFMILKLCNTICWSWFWVLFPLICGFGCVLFVAVLKIFIRRFE